MGYIYSKTVLNDFSPNKLWKQNIFFACSRHCDQGLIVVIVYYFQIWNKKEHIISSRVISSHMGPMYIETSYSCPHIDQLKKIS